MITLLTLTSVKCLLLIGMIALFIYAFFYQIMKFKKHKIDKFNEVVTEIIKPDKITENQKALKDILTHYANIIELKKEKIKIPEKSNEDTNKSKDTNSNANSATTKIAEVDVKNKQETT